MTLDNMTGITKGSYTGFCKSQLITCNRVKECNGVCPFEDALKHADKEMNEQTVIDHDRDWIIGCIEHDGFIHTDRFDKANQIIHDALSADAVQIHEDGTLEVKVPNAQKVGRVLVVDTDSHIGGGLFYPDDTVYGEWQRVDEQPYFRKHYHKVCCSVCHKQGSEKYNYCPNCGARMENK